MLASNLVKDCNLPVTKDSSGCVGWGSAGDLSVGTPPGNSKHGDELGLASAWRAIDEERHMARLKRTPRTCSWCRHQGSGAIRAKSRAPQVLSLRGTPERTMISYSWAIRGRAHRLKWFGNQCASETWKPVALPSQPPNAEADMRKLLDGTLERRAWLHFIVVVDQNALLEVESLELPSESFLAGAMSSANLSTVHGCML